MYLLSTAVKPAQERRPSQNYKDQPPYFWKNEQRFQTRPFHNIPPSNLHHETEFFLSIWSNALRDSFTNPHFAFINKTTLHENIILTKTTVRTLACSSLPCFNLPKSPKAVKILPNVYPSGENLNSYA